MEIVIYFQGEIWTSLQACWKEDWKSLGRKIFQSIFCKGKRKHKGWNQHHELPTSSKTCPMCRCLWRKSQHRYGFGNVSIKQSTLTKLIMLKIIVCTKVATYTGLSNASGFAGSGWFSDLASFSNYLSNLFKLCKWICVNLLKISQNVLQFLLSCLLVS